MLQSPEIVPLELFQTAVGVGICLEISKIGIGVAVSSPVELKPLVNLRQYVLGRRAVGRMEGGIVAEGASSASHAAVPVGAGEAALKELGIDDYIAVQDQGAAVLEVAAGTSDACVIDITMANAMTGPGTSYESLSSGISLTDEQYGVGFRKGSDLTAKFNEVMAKLMEDGTLDALAEKYSLTLVK